MKIAKTGSTHRCCPGTMRPLESTVGGQLHALACPPLASVEEDPVAIWTMDRQRVLPPLGSDQHLSCTGRYRLCRMTIEANPLQTLTPIQSFPAACW